MPLAHADESLVCPGGDVGDLLGAGAGEGVKAQHAGDPETKKNAGER
ncbi:hypothetical protein DB30_01567 [Enhygromyxa salina]|uniref:Uncharacterized protein n=1 Tax=Enhygromyxa salina TaxID=215803 RepID=A0A0C2CRS4_9BACT|nr:hypothetical protein DB30_01567 [Enhygromyxa salina]